MQVIRAPPGKYQLDHTRTQEREYVFRLKYLHHEVGIGHMSEVCITYYISCIGQGGIRISVFAISWYYNYCGSLISIRKSKLFCRCTPVSSRYFVVGQAKDKLKGNL